MLISLGVLLSLSRGCFREVKKRCDVFFSFRQRTAFVTAVVSDNFKQKVDLAFVSRMVIDVLVSQVLENVRNASGGCGINIGSSD